MGSLQRIMGAGFFSFSTGGTNSVTSVVPNCGYVTGGYNLIINGLGFGAVSGQVMIGNFNAEIISWTNTIINILVPVSTIAGQFDITITSSNIVGSIVASDAFTYLIVPTVQNSKIIRNNPIVPVTVTFTPELAQVLRKFSFDIDNPVRRIWIKEQKSNRLVSLGQIQTLNEFIRSMWQALQIHRPTLVFEPAYPIYILDVEDAQVKLGGNAAPTIPDEVVTWNVVRRTPGSVDHTAFAKTREIRPRIREELVYEPSTAYMDNPEPEMSHGPGQVGPNPDANVVGREIEGQWFDNLIQFDIWSKDNKKAEQLCDYLENFMHDFHGMFIELGVIKMHFHSRVRDEFLLKWRNGLCNRSLLYYIRTETVRAGEVREIRKIHVNTEVRTYLDAIGQVGGSAFIESSRNLIIDKWVQNSQTN